MQSNGMPSDSPIRRKPPRIPPPEVLPHLHAILLTLERIQTNKLTQMGQPNPPDRRTPHQARIGYSSLRPLRGGSRHRCESPEHLRYDGHEVIVFHVLDHQELEFEFDRVARFVDAETDEEVIATPQAIRQSYLSHLHDFINHYKLELSRSDIDYNTIDTATPVDYALSAYLAKREGLI